MRIGSLVASAVLLGLAYASDASTQGHENVMVDLWTQGLPAFGVYVPAAPAPEGAGRAGGAGGAGRGGGAAGAAGGAGVGAAGGGGVGAAGGGAGVVAAGGGGAPRYTREIGELLAANPLYDYVFLNLEGGGAYDATAISVIHEGLRSPAGVSRKTLMVRIPSVKTAGEELTRARIREAFDLGADAVTVPHVRSVDEARLVIGWFNEAVPDIWSPQNPRGEHIGMIMIEDPQAFLQAAQIADLPNFSVLACGIGSIGQAFRAQGIVPSLVELGLLTQQEVGQLGELASAKVLAESKRTGHPNMLTANAQNVAQRVADGYLALLFQGAADDAIRAGRAAAGR
jgi:hypothetical protein